MTKRNYISHEQIDNSDWDYVTSVAATGPEKIDIEDINEFLNEVDDYLSDDYYLADFDSVDMTQVQKELGL